MKTGSTPRRMQGFTLVELVLVIVVTGILVAGTSIFIAGPMRSYLNSVQRAALADTADTALRSLSRDVEAALPNSLRLTTVGSVTYAELIPALSAGHYRSQADPVSGGTPLDFSNSAGNQFEILGPYDAPSAGQQIVIFNLGPNVSASDAYAGTNRRSVVSMGAGNVVNYNASSGQFPFASPTDRFYVVNTATTYVCDPVGGTFSRYTGYAIQASQPSSTAAAPLSTATRGVLASGVTSCTISYSQTYQSRGLLSASLTLSNGSDQVNFYQEAHVPNVP